MVGILVSLGIVGAGLWLTMSENASDMGILGAMLLVLGLTFLAVNLYMHVHGFRMKRRRR
jgi:tellurite resistance protein TehA-like permease